MVNSGQIRPEDPGGPPWWKTIRWKTNIPNIQYMAVLGQYMATYGQLWSSSAGGPPEDLPGGRPSAGRPIFKIFNIWPCSASIWPPIVNFGRVRPEDSRRTSLMEDHQLEDQN